MNSSKILVVDDEPGFAQLVMEYLKSVGYQVYFSQNLEDAINLFKKHHPRVVLLDFNMPIVTGEKFLPILQGIDPMVKIIVLTGCLEEEVEEKFKGLGYFSFFQKGSISLESLRAKVQEALSY